MTLAEACRIAHIIRIAYERGEIRSLADCKFILDTMGATEVLRKALQEEVL